MLDDEGSAKQTSRLRFRQLVGEQISLHGKIAGTIEIASSGGGVGRYNHEWYGWGDPIDRPSLIVDPPGSPAGGARRASRKATGLPAATEDFSLKKQRSSR